jgi:hypothetical protein
MQQKKNQLSTINRFLDSLVIYLRENTPKKTGALVNSYRGNADINGVELYGLGYFNFIEEGVNGTEKNWGSPYSFTNKMPPASSFASYGENRYAVARSVFKNGIKPRDIITSSFDSKVDNFGDDLIESIWDDFAEEEKKKDKTIK